MKAVVVTGAERGVGKAIVKCLLEEDYHLLAVSISMSELENMKKEMAKRGLSAEKIDLIEFDLMNIENIGLLVDAIKNFLHDSKELWGYVNNAAIYFPSSKGGTKLLDISLEDIMEILNINAISAFLTSREMFRIMKETKKGGSIVFISSVASKKGSIINPVYGMTKAAIANLAKSIAREGGSYNIRANAISPGVLETQMGLEIYSTKEKLKERMEKNVIKRACTPEEVACLVKYLLSEHAGYITGENLDLSGGSLIK